MAIDAMEEIIMCEEKAKNIKENAKVFAKEIYQEIISAAETENAEKEKKYKDRLSKDYLELKDKHNILLKKYENEAQEQAHILLSNLNKHKDYLVKTLTEYILNKE